MAMGVGATKTALVPDAGARKAAHRSVASADAINKIGIKIHQGGRGTRILMSEYRTNSKRGGHVWTTIREQAVWHKGDSTRHHDQCSCVQIHHYRPPVYPIGNTWVRVV